MAMSDCPRCWETPCACGYEWAKRDTAYLWNAFWIVSKELLKREAGERSAHLEDVIISLWHEGKLPYAETLAAALGMTDEQYARWVASR